jgi:hypothetical protein
LKDESLDQARMEPKQIYSPGDDHILVEAVHRGRSRAMGIDVEAEILWLLSFVTEESGAGRCS